MGFKKQLFDAVAAPYIDKAAEKAHAKFESDRELLKKDIGRIEADIANINKLLTNHITDTHKEIKELIKGQAALAANFAKGHAELAANLAKGHAELAAGQAKLEIKIAEGQAELYKRLSLKSPDKNQ